MSGRIDLNLLQALDALLRERSVSRAATRLGLGQPAMSAALARLRLLFDDALFVRTPRGMEPTPRALQLEAPLRAALADLRAVAEPADRFEPMGTRRTFRLSGGDYAGMVLLPPLLRRLEVEAPGVDLRFRFVEKGNVLACLDDDAIDVAIGVMENLPMRFACERLLTDTLVCIVRAGHPLTEGRLTLERFIGERHILVTERGDEVGAVDVALEALGASRRVLLTVPQVSLVPMLLVQTEAIATIARCAATSLMRSAPLVPIALPFDIPPWHLNLIWSLRRGQEAGLLWLIGLIREIARGCETAGADAACPP